MQIMTLVLSCTRIYTRYVLITKIIISESDNPSAVILTFFDCWCLVIYKRYVLRVFFNKHFFLTFVTFCFALLCIVVFSL